MKIAWCDAESTGLNFGLRGDGSDSDQVIELCVKIWDDGNISRAFTQKYWPTGPIDPKALEANKYDAQQWQAGGAIHWNANAAGVFAGMLEECDMIGGANTSFDVDVLKSSFRKVRAPFPDKVTRRLVDVQSMAMPLVIAGKIEKPSLELIAAYFGVVNPAPHTAEGDVDTTIQVFEKLFGLYWPVLGVAA